MNRCKRLEEKNRRFEIVIMDHGKENLLREIEE